MKFDDTLLQGKLIYAAAAPQLPQASELSYCLTELGSDNPAQRGCQYHWPQTNNAVEIMDIQMSWLLFTSSPFREMAKIF